MRHAQRDEIRPRNAKLVGDAMDFAFFDGRDRLVGGRHLEHAPHQGELLIVGGERRKLSRDQEIGGPAKQEIASRQLRVVPQRRQRHDAGAVDCRLAFVLSLISSDRSLEVDRDS